MHRGQEAERDERRRRESEDQRPWPRIAQDRDEDHQLEQRGQGVADVAECDRPEDGVVVGHELAAGERLLDEPPQIPCPERQDREDVALVLGQVLQVVGRAAGRDERQPDEDDDAGPDRGRRQEPAQAAASPEPGGERDEEGECLRLGHERECEGRGRHRIPILEREHDRRHGEQQVDALVLAPPGRDVEDGRDQQDRDGGRHAPDDAVAQGVQREQRQPDVRQRGGQLHQCPDARVGCVGDGLEGRLDGRQHAPDVGHHRRERQVLVVGVAETTDGNAVDPQDELVEVAAEALGREERDPDDHAGDQRDRERDDQDGEWSVRPAPRRRIDRHRVRRDPTPNTARRTRPRHPARPWPGRRLGPHRPSGACRRTGAPSGSRTG